MIKFVPVLLLAALLLFGWLLPWLFSQKSTEAVAIGLGFLVVLATFAAFKLESFLKSRKEKKHENA